MPLTFTRDPHKMFLGSSIIEANPDVVVLVLSDNVIDLLLLLGALNMD